MTEFWEDESDRKTGIGVVRHRPHRIVRHRARDSFRSLTLVGCVMALVTVTVASLATSVAVRDTRSSAAWGAAAAPKYPSGPTSVPESDEHAAGQATPTVDPSEDAERRTAVGASTERATRQRRPESTPPAAPPRAPAAPASSSAPPSSTPTTEGTPDPSTDPTPEPSTDPTPEPTPDQSSESGEPKDDDQQPDTGDGTDPGSGGSEVPPVDSEPTPAQSQTGG